MGGSFLEMVLFIEVILIRLVTMVERQKMLFWVYNAVGGLFIFGGVLLKQRSFLWWGFAVKLGLLPFQQWVLLVIPQLGYVTFVVINLLKAPVLYLSAWWICSLVTVY